MLLLRLPRAPSGGLAPSNTVAPTVVDGQGNALGGAPIVGQTYWVNYGAWVNGVTGYSVQWYDDLGQLVGEASEFYTVPDTEIGRTLRFSLLAYNGNGNSTVFAAYTAAVVDIGL